jgi:hypothetical protein
MQRGTLASRRNTCNPDYSRQVTELLGSHESVTGR